MAIIKGLKKSLHNVFMRSARALSEHPGASSSHRLSLWNVGNVNINSTTASSGSTLVNRSRDITQKNAWANEIKEEWVANAIGTGIVPEFLYPSENVQKIFDEGWKRFVDECDADGRVDFYGFQALACGEIIEGSESLIRIRSRYISDGFLTPIQLQMLQSEFLPLNMNQEWENGNHIRCGIEFDRNIHSKRIAYHLYREHPGAGVTAMDENAGITTRVPAENIIHSYRMLQASQFRGQPWLSRALTRLWQFDQFVDATIGRQKLGAFMLGWTKSPEGVFNQGSTDTSGSSSAPNSTTRFGTIQPETILELRPGEEMDWFKNPEISTQYEQFVASSLREIFACAGMTLEQFDVSKVNYSSIRQGTLKFRRRCEQFQHHTICFQFNRPICNAWMDNFILFGGADKIADRLGVSRISAADYRENRSLYQAVEWRTPAWPWVDPLKDILAVTAEIRAGLKPLSVAIRERGYNPLDVLKQYQKDGKLLEQYGLVFDTSSNKVTKAGQSNLVDEEDDKPPSNQEKLLARMLLTENLDEALQ